MNSLKDGIKSFKAQDYSDAFEILMPIAKAGHPEAQCIMASIYHLGLGKEINMTAAVQWYEASAKQGYGLASSNLSELYRFGQGVEQNLEIADYWRKQAIAQGFPHIRKL